MTRDSIEVNLIPLDEMFKAFCSMDPTSRQMGVELLPLSQSDKWLQATNIIDMTNVTFTDTGLCFFKFRKRAIGYEEFLEYLEDLAQFKKLDLMDVKRKLQSCDKPVHPDDRKKKR